MLIRLLITNFLSFNEETEFNMLASSDQRSHKGHVYSLSGIELLKGAAIYGANGAGKSNIIKAITTLRTIVLEGGKAHLNDLEGFKLANNEDKPTTLEVEFIRSDTPFLYGVTVLNGSIIEEWLYQTNLEVSTDKCLFHRSTDSNSLKLRFAQEYTNTDEGRFRLKFYQNEFLKDNTLLITELASLREGFSEVKSAFDWFKHLLILFPDTKMAALSLAAQVDSSKLYKLFPDNVIDSFQTGIVRIEIVDSDLVTFLGPDNKEVVEHITKALHMGEDYMKYATKKLWGRGDEITFMLKEGQPVARQIISKHENNEGEEVDFSLAEESDGTNRLLDFVPAFYGATYGEIVVLIDEIDQSIHPALLKELVRKFMANLATKGQLIFTTHESNLLDQHIFRRDEIWFVEKNKGATQLYPLSEFDIRFDLDIRKGYLNGRFGAIPFLGNLADLNWEKYAEA